MSGAASPLTAATPGTRLAGLAVVRQGAERPAQVPAVRAAPAVLVQVARVAPRVDLVLQVVLVLHRAPAVRQGAVRRGPARLLVLRAEDRHLVELPPPLPVAATSGP